jgi:hypothetical protein
MDVLFQVVDANGLPVSGATCSASPGPTATSDADGAATVAVGAGQVSLTVSHPQYVREDAVFADIATGDWNNSLYQKVAATASTITVRVTVGRCAVAPTVEISEDRARALAKAHVDPGGVLLFAPPAFPPPARAYRFQWNATLKVRLPDARLLPPTAPPSTAHGWDRFQTKTSADVPLGDRGRFFWLLYPASGPNPFVVAIWSPNLPAPHPLPALDFITFFSPTTGGYAATYPYGLLYAGEGKAADQQYMSLGTKYLLAEYGFAYELAARGGAPTLVMPICRRGDWGPFASSEGLLRLLREVAVFLHRECRTSVLGSSQPGYDVSYRLAGGSLRSGTGIRSSYFGPVPPIGKVALGFFSTGAAPAKSVLAGQSLAQAYPSAGWGVPPQPGQDAAAAWKQASREIWDMDGFHPATGGWPNYLNLLRDWYKADPSRGFHLCHSSGRVPPPPMSYPGLLGERPGPLWTVPSAAGFGDGHELHSDRWSVVSFDDAYVANGDPTVMPALPDAHHATAMVAFAHDLSLTNVGFRRPLSIVRGP